MRIKQFAEKYLLDPREVMYFVECGLLHPERDKANGFYYDFGPAEEEEIKKILIVKAMDCKPIDQYVAMLDVLPNAMWKSVVFDKIQENINKSIYMLNTAKQYAEELKKKKA